MEEGVASKTLSDRTGGRVTTSTSGAGMGVNQIVGVPVGSSGFTHLVVLWRRSRLPFVASIARPALPGFAFSRFQTVKFEAV